MCKKGHSSLHVFTDPEWGEWETWSSCSVTCGNGTKNRERKCMHYGKVVKDDMCKKGKPKDTGPCKKQPCTSKYILSNKSYKGES